MPTRIGGYVVQVSTYNCALQICQEKTIDSFEVLVYVRRPLGAKR